MYTKGGGVRPCSLRSPTPKIKTVFHVTLEVLLKEALDFYLKWYPSPAVIHKHFCYTYPIKR